MLVLSRYRGEQILFGDGILVTVIDIRGNMVRLAINAPSLIEVHRQEVCDNILDKRSIAAAVAVKGWSLQPTLQPIPMNFGLCLWRYIDESVTVGSDILITVVDIRGDKVRLGIAAPSEVSVHRREVYESIQAELQLGIRKKEVAAKLAPHQQNTRRSGHGECSVPPQCPEERSQ